MSDWVPCLERRPLGETGVEVRLGNDLLDDYLRFVAARCRPNTVLAAGFDLKVFFAFAGKEPAEVSTADVLEFITEQRAPRRGNVVRIDDGEAGLSARTIARRLSTLSGLFGYLTARGVVTASPVPSGPVTRRPAARGERRGRVPLIRTPRTLPKVLAPSQATALLLALRTARDQAMVQAMLLGGLRRCEVLGLRLRDIQLADRRLFIAEGKGGHERVVPVASRFFTTLAAYLERERPAATATETAFVVLKGPNRGRPLTAAGVDEILRGARHRAGLQHATCHMLRHTCLTRLREAGMALEAVQAQAGHRSIESTRIYLHLADRWLAGEYHRAIDVLEDELTAGNPGGSR
ncbi:MAG TPA: tyrosine-type recombinase/integrase [Streptosporangiaceae bacterium]